MYLVFYRVFLFDLHGYPNYDVTSTLNDITVNVIFTSGYPDIISFLVTTYSALPTRVI